MQQFNPNDPYYPNPSEETLPDIPYRPVPPPYQSQPGEPVYYGQAPAPYTPPPEQLPDAAPGERAAQEKAQTRKHGVMKLMGYLRWVLVCLEVLLLLQFGLKLLGADPANPFAAFLYDLIDFLLYPFAGIVPSTDVGAQGGAVIEWSTLIAMAVYALLFSLLNLLLRTIISRPQEPIE
jgi:hypothetical protein